MPTFTPIPFDSFRSSIIPSPYGAAGTQIGETVAGLDGKHYSVDWTFNGPCLIRAEDGTQQNITSSRFVADQQANGLPGIGFFTPAYGAVGVPNTPYFYVWAQDGNYLFGQPSHICFLRYTIQADGSFAPSGGSMFVYDSTGGNRFFAINNSGGNGRIWATGTVGGFFYIAYTVQAGNGPPPGNSCMVAVPFVSTFSASNLDWLAHNIDLTSNIGTDYFNSHYRTSLSTVWLNTQLACIVDNGDGTGSCIQYVGASDIAASTNPTIHALSQAEFITFDFFFTPAALPSVGGTWTIGSLYNQAVSGITFPFSDAGKQRDGSAGSGADDYYSPSPLSIGGATYLAVPRAYGEQTNWDPQGIGTKYLIFSYTKGNMTFASGTYEDIPYDPVADFGFGGNVNLATASNYQAFVNGSEIWGLNIYSDGNGRFVYWKLFSVSSPPPPSAATSYTRVWGEI